MALIENPQVCSLKLRGCQISGGSDPAGNVDDIVVDLAAGEVRRVTASLDYDEDMDDEFAFGLELIVKGLSSERV